MSSDVHICSHWLRPRNPPLPPAFGLIYEGRCWSANIDDISLFFSRRPRVFDHWWWLEDDVKILHVLVLFILQNIALLRLRPLNQQKKVAVAESITIVAVHLNHKVPIYLEYHSVCPLVGIGNPHPISP